MSAAAPPGGGQRRGGLTRSRVVLVVLVLGVIGFGLSALPWGSASVPTVLAEQTVTVSGGEAAPATTAASLAVLATGLAVAIGGRWVARLCALALLLLGGLLGASAGDFLVDPEPRLLTAAAQLSGVREIVGEPATTPWPYLTVVLGVGVVAAAVLVLRVPTTTAPGRRFERAGEGGPVTPRTAEQTHRDERVRAMDDWDALGRGEDPSTGEHR